MGRHAQPCDGEADMKSRFFSSLVSAFLVGMAGLMAAQVVAPAVAGRF